MEACEAHIENIETSRKAAREGMVLLKNDHHILPLPQGAKVALLGKGTIDYVQGDSRVHAPWIHNIYDGFKCMCETAEQDFAVYEPAVRFYEDYVHAQYAEGIPAGLVTEPYLPDDTLQDAAAYTDTAIISISRYSCEGFDRTAQTDPADSSDIDPRYQKAFERYHEIFPDGDYCLTVQEQELISRAKQFFRHIIIVLNVGGIMDTSWFANDPSIEAVLLAWQGGMDGGTAEAQLLVGIDNPSGRLCDTLAASAADYPAMETIPSEAHTCKDYIEYTEDIYVGYRYFETIPGAAEKVNYPFGYGLSYTDFDIQSVGSRFDGDFFSFDVKVTNTGNYPGREVVQLYYSTPQGVLGKPARELGAYHKTRMILPGRSQTFTLKVSPMQMASFDDTGKIAKSSYILEKGDYSFYVGSNVRDVVKIEFLFRLPDNAILQTLSSRLGPCKLTKRLLADGTYEEMLTPENTPSGNSMQNLLPSAAAMQDAANGPAGICLSPETGIQTTCFPCATLLACTWDDRLMLDVGRAIGYEAKENNINIWLAPAVNIHRSPLCGRNFEYLSEDPYLTAKQATALIMGAQYTETMACVKYFALDNPKAGQHHFDSRCSDRALREIYLRQFELIVKEAKPRCLMVSEGSINGVRACENADLLQGILRDEWGYDGTVLTE